MEGMSTGTLLPLIYVFPYIKRFHVFKHFFPCLFSFNFHELVKHGARRIYSFINVLEETLDFQHVILQVML